MEDLSLKEGQSFSEFKEKFYKRFPDLTIFNCGDDLNLVKVVLDGLKVNYIQKGFSNGFNSFLIQLFLYLVKQIKSKTKNQIPKKSKVLLYGSHRRVNDGSNKLVYFQKFLDYYGEKAFYISQLEDISYFKVDSEKRIFLKKLFSFLSHLKPYFSDFDHKNIEIATKKFFEEFVSWDNRLKNSNIEIAHFTQHYHREGLMLALRKNKVRALELQHGLISENDIFYCFPKEILSVREKALFPDEIFLVGSHWDKVLEKGFEYPKNRRKLVSDFWEYPILKNNRITNDTTVIILVASQTLIREYLFNYAKWLTSQLNKIEANFKLIFKPHPAELAKNDGFYDQQVPQNMLISSEDIYPLLAEADIQISVYSTTLIEGHKFGVINYSLLKEDYIDYVEGFLKNEYSLPLNEEEMPILLKKNTGININSGEYFLPFNYQLFGNRLIKAL